MCTNLVGKGGGDRFILTKGGGTDAIIDFADAQDLIGLAGGLTFEQLSIVQEGSATVIRLTGSGNEIIASLAGVQVGNINAQDFIAIS